jgi:hypothetical protein
MARLNLVFLRKTPQKLGSEEIYQERIKALLAIGNARQVREECLVDTGCVLSIFPQCHWERFQDDISWLYKIGDRIELPNWLTKVVGLGAAPVDCQIGTVKIQVIEVSSGSLSPPVDIIAKFPFDNGTYHQIHLGLGGKAFSNWHLVLRHAEKAAWLEF